MSASDGRRARRARRIREAGIYTGPRKSPRATAERHPLAMPLDEYGTPLRLERLGPLATEALRILR